MTLTKKIAVVALMTTITTTALASSKTDADFSRLLQTYKVTPANDQSYCYTDELGSLQGKNINLRVRLASVSKLLTSLWAIEERGINYRYDTKLFIKGNKMHIQGSYDPFMNNEKMLFLVSQLNSLGYTHFDKITFDKNIQINPSAEKFTDNIPLITRDSNAKYLKMYFNTSSWSKVFNDEYNRLASLARSDRFLPYVNFSVDAVEYSGANPLGSNAKVLTLTSPELHKYLKETNVKSNNYTSHTIFQDLGGAAKFQKFLADKFSLTTTKVKLYTGSGLSVTVSGKREDNYATCAVIAKLVSELKASAKKQQKDISDVVAVPGNDSGTFRNRLNSSEYKNTLVAKTGTLRHTSTLAGAMNTQMGYSFFGIFNQTTDTVGAKKVQNEMVRSIMDEMGGSKVFGYQVAGFHSYDNYESVKNFDLFDEEEDASDFSVIEGNLQ